jgi:hypothetical protein
MSVSGTGDLAELQPVFTEWPAKGITGGFPIEAPGDLVYETELGQSNFYHVFGAELNDHMRAITGRGQHWWVEGIRYPGEEFASKEAERANYRRVLKANEGKRDRGRDWDAADYQEFHTVAAFRSPLDPAARSSLEAARRQRTGGQASAQLGDRSFRLRRIWMTPRVARQALASRQYGTRSDVA